LSWVTTTSTERLSAKPGAVHTKTANSASAGFMGTPPRLFSIIPVLRRVMCNDCGGCRLAQHKRAITELVSSDEKGHADTLVRIKDK
jgi:hypothetical protein